MVTFPLVVSYPGVIDVIAIHGRSRVSTCRAAAAEPGVAGSVVVAAAGSASSPVVPATRARMASRDHRRITGWHHSPADTPCRKCYCCLSAGVHAPRSPLPGVPVCRAFGSGGRALSPEITFAEQAKPIPSMPVPDSTDLTVRQGRAAGDLDLATDARPEQVREIATRWADKIWETGIEFGTIGLRKGDVVCEITTYRSDVYQPG